MGSSELSMDLAAGLYDQEEKMVSKKSCLVIVLCFIVW